MSLNEELKFFNIDFVAVISMLVYLYMVQFRMDIQEENMEKMLEKEREKFGRINFRRL